MCIEYVTVLTGFFACKTERGTASVNMDRPLSNSRFVLHVRIRFGLLSITTPVSLLANEVYV